MYRRQYLQATALAGVTALSGCGLLSETDSDVAPGISAQGVDPATVAWRTRDRIADAPYDFEWRTAGDRLGTDFFQAIYDREDEQFLLRNREGGAHFVDFYAAGEAYRNTAPGNPAAEGRFEVLHRSRFELAETLRAATGRIVRVWISGYEYDAPEEREDGIRLDIVGGQSQVPYRFDDPEGYLLVSEGGVIQDLQVAGTPVNDTGEGEPTPLDSHMEARLTLETDGIEVTEPDWVATARQSLEG
jgi:hypothetical protein